MKKLLNLFLLLIFLSPLFLVTAATDSNSPPTLVGAEDKEKLDSAIENIPLDDEGNFNGSKFAPIKSKAEMRIDAINKWLEDNTSWLSIIFGITPQISWLFALNFYFMLLFMVILVLNSSSTLGFLSGAKQWIFGLVLYLILLVTKVYVALGEVSLELIKAAWEAAVTLGIIAIVVFILILIFAPMMIPVIVQGVLSLTSKFSGNKEKRKMKEALERAEEDEKVLRARVDGIEGK